MTFLDAYRAHHQRSIQAAFRFETFTTARDEEKKEVEERERGTIIKLSAIQSFPCRFILFTFWPRHAAGPKQFVNYKLLNSFSCA